MNWDDDEHPLRPHEASSVVPPKDMVPEPAPKHAEETVTFRDIFDGTERTGKVLRSILSNEHTNPHLGKLPATMLYLVAYESAKRKDDCTVIDASLIIRPKKPRS